MPLQDQKLLQNQMQDLLPVSEAPVKAEAPVSTEDPVSAEPYVMSFGPILIQNYHLWNIMWPK